MMTRERITKILESLFIMEPAMFQVLCTHALTENRTMLCPVRSGMKRLEYNPTIIEGISDQALNEALRTEAVRILLKHPYERRPDGCCGAAMAIGSNITVGDNYKYSYFDIERPDDYSLEEGRPYEWYSRKVQELMPPGEDDGSGGGGSGDSKQTISESQKRKSSDLSQLWNEDPLTAALIDGIINDTSEWGSIPGEMVEMLKASTKARINWRHVLNGFRASILSSHRRLTRMRPSRRFGFAQMGSIRRFDTKLLVAVDVSGSISSKSLSYFYGVVNSAFRYGFESVDLIQFDCGVRMLQSLKKAIRENIAVGRGGTSFQEPVNYALENGYDGLLILTDGYAPPPTLPPGMKDRIIWVCKDKTSYNENHQWMEKMGRVCTIELN